MNQQQQQEEGGDMLVPSDETGIKAFEPQYVMVARSESGYLAIAAKLAAEGLLPKGMSQGQAAICMMLGSEYGLSPLKAINGIAVINGRPAPFGATLRGICSDRDLVGDTTGCFQGFLEMRVAAVEPDDDGMNEAEREMARALRRAVLRRLARYGWIHDGRTWQQDNRGQTLPDKIAYRCGYAAIKRKGRPVRVELFDSADAHLAGLLTKSGPWTQYPQRMLEARAVTFALRALYPDRLAGIDLTAEELDAITVEAMPVNPPAPRTSSALDELAGAPKPARAPTSDAPSAPPPPPANAPIDAEFTERAPSPSAPPSPPAPATQSATTPATTPTDPAPAVANGGTKAATGAEILRAAVARVKSEGGKPNDMHEEACRRAGLPEVKSSKHMNDTEMRRVAAALLVVWGERNAPPPPAPPPVEPAPPPAPPPGATAADDDVVF